MYCFLANGVCGNDFTQHIHIPLRKPRRSHNKLKLQANANDYYLAKSAAK